MKKSEHKKKNFGFLTPLNVGFVLTAVFLLFCCFLAFQENCRFVDDVYICQINLGWFMESGPNEMGDTFAGLAGTLAFLWIIVTVLMQGHELSLQRQELSETNHSMKMQGFEVTFFQMIRMLTSITSQMDLERRDKIDSIKTSGKDVLRTFLQRFRNVYQPAEVDLYGGEDFEKAYNKFWEQNGHELGHYFRTIYNIVKFVDNSDVDNKKFFTNILRAQLSGPETSLLFYNCLSPHGVKKFKPLVEKYSLIKNADLECMDDKYLKKQYKSSAFEGDG